MSVTDEIKARLDIVDIVGQYVPLKKAGRNYKALCPFHNEKTPSFVVFPDRQTWRCFGACGDGGDIFNFVMKKEGWTFPEALRVLAERAGVELEPPTSQQTESKEAVERLRGLLSDAAQFFNYQLASGSHAAHVRAYVEKRGLRPDTVDRFQIGYALDSWDATLNYLIGHGYTQEDSIDAGMLVVKDDGGVYDRFRDRLMIPIRDARGRMAGFGARGLARDAVPKYLNSPQSALFDKSSLLFGLDIARRSIRESETAVIVEGYMDVIQAHQAGYTNVVAQMGTALTETQLRLLSRYATRLILALDPDTAGQMATERGREVIERVSKAAAEQATEEGLWDFDAAERDYRAKLTAEFNARGMVRYESRLGFDIRVLTLPEGRDPDDLIREQPDAWPDLVANAVPIVEYVIRSAAAGQDLDDPKVKSAIARQIVPLIEDVADSVERSHYRQRLARLLRVEERALFPDHQARGARVQRARSSPPVVIPAESMPASATLGVPPTLAREAFCLAALIQNPRLIYQANRVLSEALGSGVATLPDIDLLYPQVVPGDFAHPEHRLIFETWVDALSQDSVEPLVHLQQALDPLVWQRIGVWLEQPLYALLRGVMPPDANLTDTQIGSEVIQALLDLRKKRLEEQIAEFNYVIEDAGRGDRLTAEAYGNTIVPLLNVRDRIEKARMGYTASGRRGRNESKRSRPQTRVG
jgi:DNA primase